MRVNFVKDQIPTNHEDTHLQIYFSVGSSALRAEGVAGSGTEENARYSGLKPVFAKKEPTPAGVTFSIVLVVCMAA